jgi:hypothetical protein
MMMMVMAETVVTALVQKRSVKLFLGLFFILNKKKWGGDGGRKR